MSQTINIIIVDDHSLFLEGLKSLLQDQEDIKVVETASDGKELLELVPNCDANLLLLDINMPKLNGLEAARFLKLNNSHLKIIMLSTYNDHHLIEKTKSIGADGYLLKTTDKNELLRAIRLVASGECFYPNQHSQPNEFDANDHFLRQFCLTKREVQILQLIRSNFTNQQIAQKLFLSVFTVETHRKNIMQKLGLNSPMALMKFIVENNL